MIMISTGNPRRVRRLVALFTIACGGWVPALALDCPMGPPASGPSAGASDHAAHASAGHASEAGGPAADAAASADQDHSTPHSAASCILMMGCGATGQVAPRVAGSAVDPVTVNSRALFTTTLYTTTFPAHEPPPPRLSV